MKQQIKRLSPHQNGKIAGVLMALGSLPFLIPMTLFMGAGRPHMPAGGGMGSPYWVLVLFPLLYLVLGYLSVAIGCAIYNFLYPTLGGFEFEATEPQ